ncbi:hypothetical protein M5K25_013448 [Dendrobium thyrsiflorum]|uniref:Uncharacterized protein n=1 Tax=Dendrobium thyrsiflorum TaxID=117978 RepID=A0ABD0UTM5_DENTH
MHVFSKRGGKGTQCGAYDEAGRGTCPLTGGFAAKWHRRINGYDSGPSKPGDSPPNGVTILRLWPEPTNIQPRSTRYPWTKQPMAADKDPSVRKCGRRPGREFSEPTDFWRLRWGLVSLSIFGWSSQYYRSSLFNPNSKS